MAAAAEPGSALEMGGLVPPRVPKLKVPGVGDDPVVLLGGVAEVAGADPGADAPTAAGAEAASNLNSDDAGMATGGALADGVPTSVVQI